MNDYQVTNISRLGGMGRITHLHTPLGMYPVEQVIHLIETQRARFYVVHPANYHRVFVEVVRSPFADPYVRTIADHHLLDNLAALPAY